MAKQIFINLAVKDVQKSMNFYAALGFTNNPQFSDESGKCMVTGKPSNGRVILARAY